MPSPLRAQEMQTISNPYTGDSLTIDPRNLAQRILEVREGALGACGVELSVGGSAR